MVKGQIFKKINELDDESKYVSIKATVYQIWTSKSPKIQQTGLLKDKTGVLKFTLWANSGKLNLEEGEEYKITKGKISEYEGRLSINISEYTGVELCPEEPVQRKFILGNQV